jgi:hypothetical protein
MGEAALVLIMGVLYLGGLLLFYIVLVTVIEWPEKAIRWLIARYKKRPPAPPQHHDDFDDAV